jgi:hypothetical protein
MKTQTLSELYIAGALGCLSGFSRLGAHLKWHRLGLSAFLDHETQIYQKLYAKPVSEVYEIVLWIIVTMIGFTIFKAISIGLAGLLSHFSRAK